MNTTARVSRPMPVKVSALVVGLLTLAGVLGLAPSAVAAAPSIVSVTPAEVGMGAGQSGHAPETISISADNVALSDTVTVTFPGFTGLTAVVQTPLTSNGGHTVISAKVSTSASTTVQSGFSLTLTDGANGSDMHAFAIVAAPTLTSLTPNHAVQGSTPSVTVAGTGLQTGVTLAGPINSGLSFDPVVLNASSTTAGTTTAHVANSATSGPLAVTVTNPDGGWSTTAGAMNIDTFPLTDVSPATASNLTTNTAVSLTVTGSGIPSSGTTLKLTPNPAITGQDPITATGTVANGQTTWTGAVNLASAAAGTYQVQLINGSQIGTVTSKSFTVTSAGTPTISTVSPTKLGQGADTTETITGTNFAHGAVVTFSKSTFTTTGPVVFDSATQIHVPVHVADNAVTGAANATNVTVTNSGGGTVTKIAAIEVTAAPVVSSLNPAALGQGAVTTLSINGSNFSTTGAKATVIFGTGITVNGALTVTSTQIQVPVKVDAHAPPTVSVKVQNVDFGAASKTLPINTVTLTSVSPHYVASTYTGNLVLTGSGLRTGATVAFPSGSGVSVPSGSTATATNGGTTLTVPIVVSRTSAAMVDVKVTNGTTDFGSVTCTGCLAVAVAPAAPGSPAATKTGTSATVTWAPVTADGGAPISNYTVSVTSPATSGIVAQTLPSTSTSADFTGLDASSDYVFSIVATNAANLSSKPARATTSRQAQLTISVSDRRIVKGRSIQVHGVLRDFNGAPIAGASITVRHRADGGSSTVLGTTSTGTNGRWTMSNRPSHNQTYSASFAGDAVNIGDTSPGARVLVAPRITIHAPAVSSAGGALIVRGHVSPDKSGQAVHLVAFDSSGRMHRLGSDFLDGGSAYRFSVPLAAGHWHLQVRIGRTGGNASGKSAKLRIVRD